MASQGPQSKAQLGPPGYEYTLPGYQPGFEIYLSLFVIDSNWIRAEPKKYSVLKQTWLFCESHPISCKNPDPGDFESHVIESNLEKSLGSQS